jgi:hypothetical protein
MSTNPKDTQSIASIERIVTKSFELADEAHELVGDLRARLLAVGAASSTELVTLHALLTESVSHLRGAMLAVRCVKRDCGPAQADTDNHENSSVSTLAATLAVIDAGE